MDEFWKGGLAGIIAALGVAIVNWYSARGTVKLAAQQAAAKLKVDAEATAAQAKLQMRRDALDEWQKLYEYREAEVCGLRKKDQDQQDQINELRKEVDENAAGRKDCEEKHAELSARLEAVEKSAGT